MKLNKEYEQVEELLKQIDPTETPYESKYQARTKLNDIIAKLDDLQDSRSHCQSLLGGLHGQIGIINVDVEEFPEAEKSLKKSVQLLEDVNENQAFTTISLLKSLNQLGILWCLRDNYHEAKIFLDKSLNVYNNFKSKPNEQLYELSDLFKVSKDIPSPNHAEKEDALELINTHTQYYLAQVHEKMGHASKSAECCRITLSKQLELKAFQPLDWSTNAAMLSQHYLVKEDYKSAKTLLIAASVMLNRHENELSSKEVELEDDRREMLTRCKADLARAWGKFSLLLLQRSWDKDLERAQQENQLVEVTDEDDENHVPIDDFPTIENDPELEQIPHEYATNFEQARAIFLPGQRFLNAAKNDYYKFHEHCVDYVDIQRDLSHMHKVLVYFEPDSSRRFKIHKRRIDLLEPTYQELNVQLFTLLVRQMMYEVAETYSAMMDIKLEMVKSDPAANATPQNLKKVNSLVDSSIKTFQLYLTTLNTNDNKLPEKYPEENERPALVAYFHMARLYDKYILPERSEAKLKNKMQAFGCYQYIVDYCQRNPDAEDCVQAELPLCQEMVALLPMKITKMRKELM